MITKLIVFLAVIVSHKYAYHSALHLMAKRPYFQRSSLCSTSLAIAPSQVALVDLNQLTAGCILVSQPDEFSHFLVKSAVLLHSYDPGGKVETRGTKL